MSTNKDYFNENGEVISYYENGNLKSKINYDKGNKSGKCEFWYENGSQKLVGEYFLTKENDELSSNLKIINFWDSNNNQKVIDGFGEFLDEEFFFKSKSLSYGKIENGFKEGVWKGSSKTFNFTFEENYKKGNLIKGISIDKNNVKYTYNKIKTSPEIKGGIKVFYSFLLDNFVTPDTQGLKGKVIIGFMINENGTINDLKVIRSLNPDVDREAIRVLTKFKGFSPAILRGINVNCFYMIPISIETPKE